MHGIKCLLLVVAISCAAAWPSDEESADMKKRYSPELKKLLKESYANIEINEAGEIWKLSVDCNVDEVLEKLHPLDELREFMVSGVDNDNGLTAAGFKLLARSKKLKHVHIMHYTPEHLPAERFQEIATLPELERFGMAAWGPVDDVVKFLSASRTLRRLSINVAEGAGELTDNGMRYLPRCASLEQVSIIGGKIADASMEYIAKVSTLKSISLMDAPISDKGFAKLAKLPNLESIAFSYKSRITDTGVAAIHNLTSLKTIDLRGSQITDKSLQWIGTLQDLERLSLDETNVSDGGIAHITGLKRLRDVSLLKTKVSAAGAQKLRTSLKAPGATVHHESIWPMD